MARVLIEHVSKRYGEALAVDDVSLEIAQGEFMVLLGPSGCGKTTTLRMLAGFVTPTSGRLIIGERDVTSMPPWLRNTGLVFQSYALFPHMTVAENVAFGLEMRRLPTADIKARVAEALDMVRLGNLAARLPRQLSGGQQQRVALARALAVRPDVLLLDEPLSNLDAKLRAEVRVEIRELQQRLKLTTLMVTHDQEEALTMADRLVVMNAGRVRQVGTQRDLYERPADRFVAGFVGRSNFLEGAVEADGRFRSAGGVTINVGARAAPSGPGAFAIRPEQIALTRMSVAQPALASGDGGRFNRFEGRVLLTSYLGAASDVHVGLSGGERLIVSRAHGGPEDMPQTGDMVEVSWREDAGLILPRD